MSIDLTKFAVMNPNFSIIEEKENDNISVFTLDPLEKGYGHTIGNSLRRVLLTSIPGSAVSFIKIEGISHQFDTLKGMKEDILHFILNIKKLNLRSIGSEEGTMNLRIKGPKKVYASDIKETGSFEIINKDLYLCELTDDVELDVEFYVETGMGYKIADPKSAETVDMIPVDALFSPIVKVSYKVEPTRVGRRTDYDKVLLRIETNGVISPKQALEQATKILLKQFEQVLNPTVVQEQAQNEDKQSKKMKQLLSLTVEELDFPTRISNALIKAGYNTVEDLVNAKREELYKVRNLGEKSIAIIAKALKDKGLELFKGSN